MNKILCLAVISLIFGCSGKIPYLTECSIDNVMRNACDEPVSHGDIKNGSDLKTSFLKNEKNLRLCKNRHKNLLKVVDHCNSTIVEFNKRAKQINDE